MLLAGRRPAGMFRSPDLGVGEGAERPAARVGELQGGNIGRRRGGAGAAAAVGPVPVLAARVAGDQPRGLVEAPVDLQPGRADAAAADAGAAGGALRRAGTARGAGGGATQVRGAGARHRGRTASAARAGARQRLDAVAATGGAAFVVGIGARAHRGTGTELAGQLARLAQTAAGTITADLIDTAAGRAVTRGRAGLAVALQDGRRAAGVASLDPAHINGIGHLGRAVGPGHVGVTRPSASRANLAPGVRRPLELKRPAGSDRRTRRRPAAAGPFSTWDRVVIGRCVSEVERDKVPRSAGSKFLEIGGDVAGAGWLFGPPLADLPEADGGG